MSCSSRKSESVRRTYIQTLGRNFFFPWPCLLRWCERNISEGQHGWGEAVRGASSVDKDGFSRPLFACRCTTHPPSSVPGIQSRTVTVKTGPKLLQPILQCVVSSVQFVLSSVQFAGHMACDKAVCCLQCSVTFHPLLLCCSLHLARLHQLMMDNSPCIFWNLRCDHGLDLRTPLLPSAKFPPIGLHILFWIEPLSIYISSPATTACCIGMQCFALPPSPDFICRPMLPLLLFNSSVLSFINNTWIEFPPGPERGAPSNLIIASPPTFHLIPARSHHSPLSSSSASCIKTYLFSIDFHVV